MDGRARDVAQRDELGAAVEEGARVLGALRDGENGGRDLGLRHENGTRGAEEDREQKGPRERQKDGHPVP